MGFRLKVGSWRAPLQIIDSLLPRKPSPDMLSLSARSGSMQLFCRAGWLRGRQATELQFDAGLSTPPDRRPVPCSDSSARVVHIRRVSGRKDARVVVSGRMSDVCAELERLAAKESQMGTA